MTQLFITNCKRGHSRVRGKPCRECTRLRVQKHRQKDKSKTLDNIQGLVAKPVSHDGSRYETFCRVCRDLTEHRSIGRDCLTCHNRAAYIRRNSEIGEICYKCGTNRRWKIGASCVACYYEKHLPRLTEESPQPRERCRRCRRILTRSNSFFWRDIRFCEHCYERYRKELIIPAEWDTHIPEHWGKIPREPDQLLKVNNETVNSETFDNQTGYERHHLVFQYNKKMDQSYKAALFKFDNAKTEVLPFSAMAKQVDAEGRVGIAVWKMQQLRAKWEGETIPASESG